LSQEKTEEDEWPRCVFYPDDIKCPVRFSIVSSSSMKKIMEPKMAKFDDRTTGMEIGKSMMEGMMKAIGMEWSVLAAFCHICPFKYKEDQKLTMKPSLMVPKVSEELLECPKCHLKGFFYYCPKCGTKVAKE